MGQPPSPEVTRVIDSSFRIRRCYLLRGTAGKGTVREGRSRWARALSKGPTSIMNFIHWLPFRSSHGGGPVTFDRLPYFAAGQLAPAPPSLRYFLSESITTVSDVVSERRFRRPRSY